MRKITSLVSSLFVVSMLFWGVPAQADSVILKTPLELTNYCHMRFPTIREDTLSWSKPVLNEGSGSVIDFYGSCDHDPVGADEIRTQKSVLSDELE